MKYILLSLLSMGINSVLAQVDSKGKILDNEFDCKEVVSNIKNSINYEKYSDDGFVRFEDNKVQLFNGQLEKKWEHQLDMLEGVGNINWMICANDGENIYIMQYSTAIKIESIKSRLVKITQDGEMTHVDLDGIVKLRGVGYLGVQNNEIFTNVAEVKGALIMGVLVMKVFSHNLKFTSDLKPIGEPFTLPAFAEDEKFNFLWGFVGQTKDNYNFECHYFIDTEGNPTENNEDAGAQVRRITVNNKGDILEDNVSLKVIPDVFNWAETSMLRPKYDTMKYKVFVSGCSMKNKFTPAFNSDYSDISIESGGLKSKNLIAELYSWINPKMLTKKSLPKYRLIEVVSNKQNGGVQILLYMENVYTYYLLSVDEDLKVTHVSEFKSAMANDMMRIGDQQYFLYASGEKKSYGNHSEGYVKTPLDFALSIEGLNFSTIIDFDDYQLLIIDNKKEKSTTAYKFKNR